MKSILTPEELITEIHQISLRNIHTSYVLRVIRYLEDQLKYLFRLCNDSKIIQNESYHFWIFLHELEETGVVNSEYFIGLTNHERSMADRIVWLYLNLKRWVISEQVVAILESSFREDDFVFKK